MTQKLIGYLLLFLFLNFGALALGAFLQSPGPMSDWYLNLTKAPWTPPGWFFGVAWTTIMICFSIFMAKLISVKNEQKVWLLFGIQWVLNVIWNPLFFNLHWMGISLVEILSLTALVAFFLFHFRKDVGNITLLLLPYLLWLLVASTLNAYALIMN